MALGASVYKLVFDTQGLQNVTASRREVALQKKIMEETTPVVDKLAQAEANLDRLVAKDLITQEQRNRTLAKVRDELIPTAEAVDKGSSAFRSGVPQVDKYASSLATLGPIGLAAAVAFKTFSIATDAVGAAIHLTIDAVTEQIGKIDDLMNAAETISVPVDQFQRLAIAADYADISQDKFAKGTEKMLIAISKGADGSKKFVDTFNLIELDVRKLSEMQPDKAFRTITEALDRIPNSADRVRAATAIFGEADFLRIDTEHIDRANTLMDRLRANLDETDASVFSEFDANTKDLNAALDVTVQKLAMEIVPALSDAAAAATEWLVNLNQNETFTDTLREIGDALTVIVAVGSEVPGVIDKWAAPMEKAASIAKLLNIGGAGNISAIASAADAATKDIAEQARRTSELDAKIRERQKASESGKPLGVDDDDGAGTSGADKAQEAADKLTESLKEQAETFGMTSRMAAIYRSEMENNGRVNVEGRQAAALLDQMEQEKKLRDESAKAAEAAAKKTEDALKGVVAGLRDEEAKLKLSARAYFERDLAKKGVTEPAERAKLGDQFDRVEKLKKEKDATKLATDAIKDYEKQIRQANMTAGEKKLDDLKVAGVSDEQLKIIATLEKELALRESIHKELDATSGVIKAGSREAADAFAKANQAAVRKNALDSQLASAAQKSAADKAREQLNNNLGGGQPAKSAADKARDQLNKQLDQPDADARSAAERIREQLNEQLNRKSPADKVRDQLSEQLNKPSAADRARSQLMDNLAGSTVTPMPPKPTIASASPSMDQPQAKEQLKEAQKTNALLAKILEKPVTIEVEEVTL